jgi:trans-2,3-dihydro-3-hydroxyanthranilate isomerase
MTIDYVTVDVFTETRFCGNPVAVVPDARGLDEALMQRIAAEFNYSESTFVFPASDSTRTAQVRIFTPKYEVPFAGHPNVGTAFVLARQGMLFGKSVGETMCFEEKAGLVNVDVLREGTEVFGAGILAPKLLEVGAEVSSDIFSACVSLGVESICVTTHRPHILSVGLPFAVAELSNLEALANARPGLTAISEAAKRYRPGEDRFSVFVYTRIGRGIHHLRARMFAPLNNILEDPATGSASAALASYLAYLDPCRDAEYEIEVEQGVEMGRRSLINCQVRKTAGYTNLARISGRCVLVMHGSIEI